jgi:cytochrome P450
VEEGARIAFPLPARVPRVFQDHALHYKEWTIEPGISVSQSGYVVTSNEDVFPEPFEFKPERWLGEKGKGLQKYAVTFGRGRRGCLGKKYVDCPATAALLLTCFQSGIRRALVLYWCCFPSI